MRKDLCFARVCRDNSRVCSVSRFQVLTTGCSGYILSRLAGKLNTALTVCHRRLTLDYVLVLILPSSDTCALKGARSHTSAYTRRRPRYKYYCQ